MEDESMGTILGQTVSVFVKERRNLSALAIGVEAND